MLDEPADVAYEVRSKLAKHGSVETIANIMFLFRHRYDEFYFYNYDDPVLEKLIQRLEKRLTRLTNGTYSDSDCKRYVKRLKREGSRLFAFLRHDIEYHNNTGERALRLFAVMRKTLYGSRSERGLETTETMATIHATCQLRRVNPYHFIMDYLNGRIDSIPKADRLQCMVNSDKPNTTPDCATVTA